jgi:membrane protein required for beta-lactamase induction
MSFTAIFIALLLERFFDCSHLRNWSWYAKYQRMIMQKLQGQKPYVGLAATVIPIVIAVVILEMIISNVAFGFLKLAFSVFVILYCFGPRNLWADTFACLNALSDGDTGAAIDKLKISFGVLDNVDPPTLHRRLINAIFTQANRRVFALVFWFGIFGLSGVVFYRLISLFVPEAGGDEIDAQLSNSARQVESYLDWPSIRALTFVFALGGNFSRVLACWRAKAMLGPESNDALLSECGMAALTTASQETLPVDGSVEKEEISLLDRSLAIVLVVIAVLVFLIP